MELSSDQLSPRSVCTPASQAAVWFPRAACLVAAAGLCVAASAHPFAGDPTDVTFVPSEGDPLDLPGREPAPKTRTDVQTPAPVQSGAKPEKAPEPRDWFGADGKSWLEWSRFTGDWGGTRTAMEKAGLTFAGSLRFDWTDVASGGVSDGSYNRRLVDLNLTLDLDPATNGAWTNATVYADFYHYGGQLGEPSGSIQGTDVIGSPRHLDQLAEIWFQQVFFDGQLRVKVGKMDANVEFAALPCATGFVSANGAWDANLLDMPTYPDPAFGGVFFWTPNDTFYAGVGVFDGATHDGYPTGARGPATLFSDSKSDSWYTIAEAGVNWAELGGMGSGRLSVGGWYHSGDYTRFDATVASGTGGFYVAGQQQLTRRGDTDELKKKGWYAFARAAFADGDLATVQTHISAGLVSKGTFDGRDSDEAGLMWSFAGLSDASGASGDESLVELYYTIAAAGSVSVTPYLQWVSNPSGNAAVDDAVLVGVEVKVSF